MACRSQLSYSAILEQRCAWELDGRSRSHRHRACGSSPSPGSLTRSDLSPQAGRGDQSDRYAMSASFRGLRERRAGCEVDDAQRGADALGGAVLEADHGIDGNLVLAAIDAVDDVGISLVDHCAAHFPGAGEFAVVGVEFLVEQEEAGD